MEISKAEKIRLGLFFAVTTALLVGVLVFYFGKRLSNEMIPYYTRFAESVDGLSVGAKVKWNGVTVGRVTRLTIDEQNLQEVIVDFEVNSETPIRGSMLANLVGGISITGIKSIELTGGNPADPKLKPHRELKASPSQMKVLNGHADVLMVRFGELLENLLMITNAENRRDLSYTLANAADLSQQLKKADFPGMSHAMTNAAVTFEATASRANKLMTRTQEDVAITLRHIKEISENLDDFSRQIKADPSLLIRGEQKIGRK